MLSSGRVGYPAKGKALHRDCFVRRGFRFLRDFITGAALLVFGLLIAARVDGGGGSGASVGEQVVSGPFRVSDGDTLAIGRQRFRLQGIDAPELRQTCRKETQEWACGVAARQTLAALVKPAEVRCEGHEADRYGRLLVVCHNGATVINARMVAEGMAVSYGGQAVSYRLEEAQARREGRGLWGGAFERPQDWRRMNGGMEGGLRPFMDAVLRFFGFGGHEEGER